MSSTAHNQLNKYSITTIRATELRAGLEYCNRRRVGLWNGLILLVKFESNIKYHLISHRFTYV